MSRRISNSDDLIDSRDVIRRLAELEADRESLVDVLAELQTDREYRADADSDAATARATADLAEWDNGDDAEELTALRRLNEAGELHASDWTYGATLISDSYFETYARDLAEDIGAIGRDCQWPLMHIDWTAAAEALQMDYSQIDYDGTPYWVRS